MAAVGCMAAPEAAEQRGPAVAGGSLWPVRRARRTAAKQATLGRLAAALERVVALEGTVSVLEAQLAMERARHAAAAAQAVRLAGQQDGTKEDILHGEIVTRAGGVGCAVG